MSDFNFKQKPNRLKHLCCPEKPEKWLIYNPLLLSKFPCRIKMTRQIQASPGSNNHNQCYTVANQTLNAYGKWAGCPGGSGPGYSSTMRYVPNEIMSGLGPTIGGSICNCNSIMTAPPVNIIPPVISGNTVAGSTLTCTTGVWTGLPYPMLTYQWYRGITLIVGQVSTTYVTQFVDIGQAITCKVTGTNTFGSAVATSNIITPITVLLIDTNNYIELIYTTIYYLAQVDTPYVMPAGSYMTSFTLYINGTNVVINFQNATGTPLFTWYDNQTRVSSTATTVNLATAVNITGCSQFTFSNLINASASYPGTGIANIGIRIYGYTI
jgi:hypothetical protein